MGRPSLRAALPIVVFQVDGRVVEAREGDTVASALLAVQMRALRRGPDGAPRGVFCGIGVCFDCLVTIDGHPGQRACVARVREGMEVASLQP